MARRSKFSIGDLFLILLEENYYGVGRILRSFKSVILVEFYKMKPIKSESEFVFSEANKETPIVTHWCYDTSIKRGGWKIFDNKPVPDNYDMPYFWHENCLLTGDSKYYIQKGTNEPLSCTGDKIEITKDDLYKYDSNGLGNEVTEREKYIIKLKAAGLM